MMNPFDLVFSSVSQMTGGLVNDVQTVVVAVIGFQFIVFGLEILGDFLIKASSQSRAKSDAYSAHHDMIVARKNGSFVAEDLARARYRRALSRYAKY